MKTIDMVKKIREKQEKDISDKTNKEIIKYFKNKAKTFSKTLLSHETDRITQSN